MSLKSAVDVADRKSRLRAVLFGAATVIFLIVQLITRPAFSTADYAHGWRQYAWALNAVALLICFSFGSGIFNSTQVQALMNDDVARSNYRTASVVAFWLSVLSAILLFIVPSFETLSGKQVSYLITTIATAAALLTFSWLEIKSHKE
jgi:hypothetical protein